MKRNSKKKVGISQKAPAPVSSANRGTSPAENNAATAVLQDRTILWCALLFLTTAIVFLPSLRGSFVDFDDPTYVTANNHVSHGLTLGGLKWAFTSTETSNWHPLTWISHMVDCQLFGLKPWGHHLTSVLIHALNTVLVFLVFRRMTGAMWRSLFIAAIFGLHPLRVESVVWVSERKDVLSTFFWMLALWTYVRFTEEAKAHSGKAKLFYGLTALLFAFGLMSKPMLVTFPCVLLLLDYWPLKRILVSNSGEPTPPQSVPLLRAILEKIPFFLLAALVSAITMVAQRGAGAVISLGGLPFDFRAENALVSYGRYLGKIIWPVNLCVFYPLPAHWPIGAIILAGAILTAFSALAIALRRRPYLATGWFWFVGTLVPTIGLVQVGSQAMADRYSYIPSVGLLALITWGVCDLAARWRHSARVLAMAGVALTVACAGLTLKQIGYWQNSETLFQRAVAVTHGNFMAYNRLGSAYYQNGDFDQAIIAYQEAIKLNPNFAEGQSNLGTSLVKKGRMDEAIVHLREAVRLQPTDADACCNLGVALGSAGRVDEAIVYFKKGVELKPSLVDAHNNLGIALAQKGRLDEAISEFQEAVRLDPNHESAKQNLAALLAQKAARAKH